jgi:hypothetical protein
VSSHRENLKKAENAGDERKTPILVKSHQRKKFATVGEDWK